MTAQATLLSALPGHDRRPSLGKQNLLVPHGECVLPASAALHQPPCLDFELSRQIVDVVPVERDLAQRDVQARALARLL
jgi:hypothetical protein